MKYYRVKVKCGHVGRNNYIDKNVYLCTCDAKTAAQIARKMPRVKHHHKDAIREVEEIDYVDYLVGRMNNELDPYFNVSNSSDQSYECDLSNEVRKEEAVEKPKKKRNKQFVISSFLEKEWRCQRSYFYE